MRTFKALSLIVVDKGWSGIWELLLSKTAAPFNPYQPAPTPVAFVFGLKLGGIVVFLKTGWKFLTDEYLGVPVATKWFN